MEIENKHFKTKKELEEHVRTMIKNIGICQSIKIKNIDDYNFLIDLFKRHPDYPEKIHNIKDIAVVLNMFKKFELNIIKNDNTIEDISWKCCIKGYGIDKFKSALRVSIDEQIKNFRKTCKNECSICKKIDADEYHVDHENYFEYILYNFLQTTKKIKPTTFKNTNDNRKSFTLKDKDFDDEWKIYHKNTALLRLLCKSCNLKRPKWKIPTEI